MLKALPFILTLGIANATGITFEKASNNSIRELPTSKNKIISFSSILKDPIKSVVNISVKLRTQSKYELMYDPFFGDYYERLDDNQQTLKKKHALGSGVILSKNGYIVTNNHVVEDAKEISVSLGDNDKEYPAKLIGRDKGSDLAVIKIEADNLKPIKFANAKNILVGDVVFAIGNPFGVGETVTQGIVSAINKHGIGINKYENFIQTDASINPGNSGGALVDSRGALVGINSAILSKSGGNHGIGFSIPVDMVQNIVSQLINRGSVTRGYMGVSIAPIESKTNGLYNKSKGAVITDVQPNGAAYKAGLKRGDLVYMVNTTKIDSPSTLQRVIASQKPGGTVDIYVERDKREIVVQITLNAQSTGSSGIEGLGLKMIDDNDRYRLMLPVETRGVLVSEVVMNSRAYEEGFSAGDVIVQVDNREIYTLDDWNAAMREKHKKRVYINRGGTIMLATIE